MPTGTSALSQSRFILQTMKLVRRFIYFLYYIRNSDFHQLRDFLTFSSTVTGKSKLGIAVDTLISTFRYNVSIKDYFQFGFYEKRGSERKKWAGTGFMYEYQLQMNPKESREILENKILFLNRFNHLIRRDFTALTGTAEEKMALERLLSNRSGRIVLKGSRGQTGAEVEVVTCRKYTPESLLEHMNKSKYDLVEEYVEQHPLLDELSPSGLNTVRIITQVHNNEVIIIAARLRISVNSYVDNMAAGNLAAPVDIRTGHVTGPGVYSDITKLDQSHHPITGKLIIGFTIPYWNEAIEMARKAAIHSPVNNSVGWDIAITSGGPELIEGNHNWCKTLWQLPVKQGLRKELERFL